MSATAASASPLEGPFDADPDPDKFVRTAMRWHFDPATGSPYWLERASTLDFDPRADVKGFEDLTLFPSIVHELRDVRAEDLVPRGHGPEVDLVGTFESGGTTGAPKRVVFTRDWWERTNAWTSAAMDAHGVPKGINWLILAPHGPHVAGRMAVAQVTGRGGHAFTIDMDPRWVKQLIAAGRTDEAGAYTEHLVDQAALVLATQDIGGLLTTPALLERLCTRDDLVDRIAREVKAIWWAGTHMDADSRQLYRNEIFPDTKLFGSYGSTMMLGVANERPGLTGDDPCVFDPYSPWTTFRVVDPGTGEPVPYGARGRVVVNHVSGSALLPNNLERDTAIRIEPLTGCVGDAVADVQPVERFEDEAVIEGVY